MGKIRVKTFGDETQEQEEKKKKEQKRAEKLSRAKSSESEKTATTEAQKKDETLNFNASETLSDSVVAREELTDKKSTKTPKVKKAKFAKKAFHSQRYDELLTNVDRTRAYSLKEALGLLEKIQRKNLPRQTSSQGGFDETVELHINTTSPGVSGNVTLPHGTGKKTRVAIADDGLISEIEKGIINFDILVASPSMMGKLAKVAKVLGPRGLMPNPKNGTITEKPEDLVKKYEGGQINFKTENKNPLLHLTVGKMSFGENKLSENIETMIAAVKKSNIVNVTLKSTMSPGIKIKV